MNLRKFSLISMSLALLAGGWSCTKTEPTVKASLSSDAAVFGVAGGSRTIAVTVSEGAEWDLVAPPASVDWCTVEKGEASITVTVTENTTGDVRSTSMTVNSPKGAFAAMTLNVLQEKAAAEEAHTFVTNAMESYEFDSEGGSYTFVVASNSEWSAVPDEDAAKWLTVKVNDKSGTVTMTAPGNTGDARLAGTVTVTDANGEEEHTKTISLLQYTRAENPYFQWIGKWKLTAPRWYYATTTGQLMNGASYHPDNRPSTCIAPATFKIIAGKYKETYYLEDFLEEESLVEVNYDLENNVITLNTNQYMNNGSYIFPTTINNSNTSYYAMAGHAGLSWIITGEMSEDLQSVTLSGFKKHNDTDIYAGFGAFWFNDSGTNYYYTRYTFYPVVYLTDDPATEDDETVMHLVRVTE